MAHHLGRRFGAAKAELRRRLDRGAVNLQAKRLFRAPDPAAMTPAFDLGLFQAARARIAGRVRRTPMLAAPPVKSHAGLAADLVLKVESLQVTGSFKPRGAVNAVASLAPGALAKGIVTASGGNHGLAVAYAARSAGAAATIFLPETAAPAKIAKLRDWGASVVVGGARWDEANRAALDRAGRDGAAYIHPFADPAVIAGQGTLGLEIVEDAPAVETVLVAIGGGGLIAGVAAALKAVRPGVRIVGVEPVGAPTLHASLAAGAVTTLARIETEAVTLAAGRTEAVNFDLVRRHVEGVVLVTDDDMRQAARWLWFEAGIGAELSGAAAVAALLAGKYRPRPGEKVCAIVCGAGTDGMA
jgi:threonine dehydratase